MKVITVSGAHSSVGKTTLAEGLLKILKGWAALKVTVLHTGACPKDRDCGACSGVANGYSIAGDKKIINQEGKDTRRFKNAGAREVLWLKAEPRYLKEGLKEALARFKKAKGVIVETTSGLKYLKPDFSIFLKNKNSELKRSAKKAIKKADWVLTV